MNAYHLDGMVWERVTDLLTDPEQIKKQANLWIKKSKEYKDVAKIVVKSWKRN